MQVFRAKLRRVGNGLGVLVPKAVAEEAGAEEGEEIQLAIVPSERRRARLLRELVGSEPGLGPFRREKDDRF